MQHMVRHGSPNRLYDDNLVDMGEITPRSGNVQKGLLAAGAGAPFQQQHQRSLLNRALSEQLFDRSSRRSHQSDDMKPQRRLGTKSASTTTNMNVMNNIQNSTIATVPTKAKKSNSPDLMVIYDVSTKEERSLPSSLTKRDTNGSIIAMAHHHHVDQKRVDLSTLPSSAKSKSRTTLSPNLRSSQTTLVDPAFDPAFFERPPVERNKSVRLVEDFLGKGGKLPDGRFLTRLEARSEYVLGSVLGSSFNNHTASVKTTFLTSRSLSCRDSSDISWKRGTTASPWRATTSSSDDEKRKSSSLLLPTGRDSLRRKSRDGKGIHIYENGNVGDKHDSTNSRPKETKHTKSKNKKFDRSGNGGGGTKAIITMGQLQRLNSNRTLKSTCSHKSIDPSLFGRPIANRNKSVHFVDELFEQGGFPNCRNLTLVKTRSEAVIGPFVGISRRATIARKLALTSRHLRNNENWAPSGQSSQSSEGNNVAETGYLNEKKDKCTSADRSFDKLVKETLSRKKSKKKFRKNKRKKFAESRTNDIITMAPKGINMITVDLHELVVHAFQMETEKMPSHGVKNRITSRAMPLSFKFRRTNIWDLCRPSSGRSLNADGLESTLLV